MSGMEEFPNPFSANELQGMEHLVRLVSNMRGYVSGLRQHYLKDDSSDLIVYDPAVCGEEVEAKVFKLDKESLKKLLNEIDAATGDDELDMDVRIYTTVGQVSALLRGETIEEELK